MRVLLLAAGFGTRLLPLTADTPKCLMLIKGKPLLEIWLEKLIGIGAGPFLVNTHYLHKKVENFMESSPYKANVYLVYEEKLRGTAGTLIHNKDFFVDDDLLLIHADNYYLGSLHGLINAHSNRPKECLLTMMTFRTDDPKSCGIVEINERDIVIGFHEKVSNPPGNLANGAIYVISSKLIKHMAKDKLKYSDFSNDVLPHLLGKIYAYETVDPLIDIGNIDAYKKANLI